MNVVVIQNNFSSQAKINFYMFNSKTNDFKIRPVYYTCASITKIMNIYFRDSATIDFIYCKPFSYLKINSFGSFLLIKAGSSFVLKG